MRKNSYRNQIATGVFTYPVCVGLMVAAGVLTSFYDLNLWIGIAVVGLTSLLLAELNNRDALIRTRSQMISACFVGLLITCPELLSWSPAMIPMVCLVLSYYQFFATYQQPHPEGKVFAGFLSLGIAGWFYSPLIVCALPLYLGLLLPLRAFTWRTFFAGIFGMALPFWFYAGWAIWNDQLTTAFLPFLEGFQIRTTDYSLPPCATSCATLVMLTTLCSVVHLTYTAYNDKIRTRMFYYVIILVEIFILAGFFLHPQAYKIWLGLLIANSSPLIAHYFTLGRGRILDYWFLVCLLLWVILIIFNQFNLWTLLSNF